MHTRKMIAVLPFYHIYGAVKLLHFPMRRGVPVVILPRFEAVQFCTTIQKYKITDALVVPPMILFLAKHPGLP
jgi:acyl-CoA synthetase (AMP-forming)/AMP-acid ligase II